jgi:hypothetical protein
MNATPKNGEQSAERKTRNRNLLAEFSPDRDVLVNRRVEVVGAKETQRRRQAIDVSVPRQSRNQNVMSPRKQLVGISLELRGTGAHAVQQHEGARPLACVHVDGRSALRADPGMIARDKAVEAWPRGSQGKRP